MKCIGLQTRMWQKNDDQVKQTRMSGRYGPGCSCTLAEATQSLWLPWGSPRVRIIHPMLLLLTACRMGTASLLSPEWGDGVWRIAQSQCFPFCPRDKVSWQKRRKGGRFWSEWLSQARSILAENSRLQEAGAADHRASTIRKQKGMQAPRCSTLFFSHRPGFPAQGSGSTHN